MSTLTLFDAAQQGDIETCKLLLENGANVNAAYVSRKEARAFWRV